MTQNIRWGILGCGRIARKFAADLRHVPDSELVALGSLNPSNLEEFSKTFQVPHTHDSYEGLAANDQVDVIYIATPHALHHKHALLCLNRQKEVLCEKAFALISTKLFDMFVWARTRKYFL